MSKEIDIWKKDGSRQIADCRVFSVREDLSVNTANGQKATFFVIENPDWVNIIALTPDRRVVLIEQFRHGTQSVILEIPGGMIDPNEDPRTAADRELTEETGYRAGELIFLGKSHPNPALQSNTIHHFLALDCRETGRTDFDEHESLVNRLVSVDEIPGLIERGRITHSLAITGFYYLTLFLAKQNQAEAG